MRPADVDGFIKIGGQECHGVVGYARHTDKTREACYY
jgi:hypothetical protein